MSPIDPEIERRRLADFYSRQLDGELEKVAQQAYELTDVAREALRAELTKRSINVALIENVPAVRTSAVRTSKDEAMPGDPPLTPPLVTDSEASDGDLEYQEVVTLRQFRDLPEALLAKGSLESSGIECWLVDDNMVRLDWLISNGIGGIKLQVKGEDAEAASEMIEQPIPENFDVSGIGEYEQPRCPKCQSLDVNFQEPSWAAYASLMVKVPIPFHRRAWHCRSCNVEWEDDGKPDPNLPESTA